MSHVRDMSLAESGRMKIRWVQDFMPALVAIRARFEREKPFAGKKITISIHMEAKTAFLALCLAAGGAEVHATGCNPLSTQDDVAAGLASMGVETYAIHGVTSEEYQQLFSEIDYVKDHVCMRHAEPTDEVSSFDETKAGYDGIWTKVEDLFELYIPTEWDACQPDEEDIAGGVKYISVSEDKAYICMAMATEPDNEETRKEIEQELADNNMTMMDVLKEQINEQGFKLEKEAEINGIPCVFCSTDSLYGIVFIDQKDATQIDMVIFAGENRGNDQIVETVLRSVRWLPEE